MKIAIYGRKLSKNYLSFVNGLFDNLLEKKIKVVVYKPFYDFLSQQKQINLDKRIKVFEGHKDISTVDYLFSIGGDGTLLDTVTLVRDSDIPILGINTGRLGFLTSVTNEETDEAINEIIAGNFELDSRTLLSLYTDKEIFGEVNYALNEITLQKKDTSSMVTIHAYLGDELLNSYWADGLIISTPTGSTAYSLSCGGPIILPSSGNIIVNPIAPHNLNVRPIVIPDDIELTLKIEGRAANFLVALDSRSFTMPFSKAIKIKKAKHSIKLIRFQKNSFLDTLRTKLMWGLDKRN